MTDNTERRYKKTITGVIHTQDGSIICVRLKMKNGRWSVESANSWPASNLLKTTLALCGGAALGLYAEWHRTAPNPALEPPISQVNAGLNTYLHRARVSVILEALSGNITSVVTEDSFLLTLPFAFGAKEAESFLSIFLENGIVKFGIVIARKLEAVFSFPCNTVSSIEASVGRVKRYWSHTLKRIDFPQKAFVFNSDNQINNCDGLDAQTLALPEELCDSYAMKAAGAALAALYPAPAFRVPQPHNFKIHRKMLLKAAAILLCISLITTSVPVIANFHAKRRLANSEKIYITKLNENKSLQNLEKTANELSSKILSIQKTYANRSRWGDLLRLLGEIKPDGLFLERLGSDQIQRAENKMRVALSGWSQSESSVTEFISALQRSNYISGASLASMERDAKNKNICRFRILCTVQFTKD